MLVKFFMMCFLSVAQVNALRRGFDLILYDDLDGNDNALSNLHQLDKIQRE